MKRLLFNVILIFLFCVSGNISVKAQGTFIEFGTIPERGTALVYSHLDDDLIWMLPFWQITDKFIGGAMPSTPWFDAVIRDQQVFLDNNGYNIQYEPNSIIPWGRITDTEYTRYYWHADSAYSYLAIDHLETRLFNDPTDMSVIEINKIKAKLEQYIAGTDVSRVITHNNWGEYGHRHHKAVNKAVRELAVKYRKDVWMLGCDNGDFKDVDVPAGITYTLGSFNTPDLYTGIRTIYQNYQRWTWSNWYVPSGDHKFIKIVENGIDKSNILTGEEVTLPGPFQSEPGAYMFDGIDDYMTLQGNNHSSFTIAMKIMPDQIKGMEISKMAEYPGSEISDRSLYVNHDGTVSGQTFDGSPRVVTSTTELIAGDWIHIAMTSTGSELKLYVKGFLETTVSANTPTIEFSSPEFLLGHSMEYGSFFNGQISDIRLFDYALTDSEIAILAGLISPVTHAITAIAGLGGSIDSSGSVLVNQGEDKTFFIVADTLYEISDVLVDDVSVGAVSEYTFENVVSDHTITAEFSIITGIYSPVEKTKVRIYPNPFAGEFTLEIESPVEELFEMSLIDLSGNLIYKYPGIPVNIENSFDIQLNPGIYILRLTSKNRRLVFKIVKC